MHPEFLQAARGPVQGSWSCYLEGPVGSGKTQALCERLRHLLALGVPGYSILVLLPDRAARHRYAQTLAGLGELGPFGNAELHTYYSLASQLVRLFWPLVAGAAGFAAPQRPPVFLTYETAQYLMGQLVAPLLGQGFFEGLVMRPQRVLSQLLDNLNKAAVNGYPLAEVEGRLRQAWTGPEDRDRSYEQAQRCAELFRGHCLQHGLLDLSLTVEVFHRHLVEQPLFWRYFADRFRHLLVDHLEESVPVAQDLVRRLLSGCDSALLAGDPHGGFRVFMGVDAEGAGELGRRCGQVIRAGGEPLAGPGIAAFVSRLGVRLGQPVEGTQGPPPDPETVRLVQTRYRAQMIAAVAGEIAGLVEGGVAPGDIAVVAPYTDGVLRFMLGEAFAARDIPFAVVRRYESLREEPLVRACLSLAALAHPDWEWRPPLADVSEALAEALAPLDPVRAALVVRLLYDPQEGALGSEADLEPAERERLGPAILERYAGLRQWLEACRGDQAAPFDHFLRRLFGEVLSTPQLTPEQAGVYSKLIASATYFRQVAPALGLERGAVGPRYAEMVFGGVVAAQYLVDLDLEEAPDSIALVAPIYTFLLSQRVTRVQFWLDIGSRDWWEPPHQPLTNPHVLARRWPCGERWTEAVDWTRRNQTLFRLIRGLAQRCRERLYLCGSELEGGGQIQDSPLARIAAQVLAGT